MRLCLSVRKCIILSIFHPLVMPGFESHCSVLNIWAGLEIVSLESGFGQVISTNQYCYSISQQPCDLSQNEWGPSLSVLFVYGSNVKEHPPL